MTLGAVVAICLLAQTQNTLAADKGNRGQLSARDFRFATEAAQANKSEVALGQLAAQKATDPSVRDFGQRMVQDHQKADDQLKQILSQKGATLPTETTTDGRAMEHLKNLSGSDFDKAYIKHMVRDHKNDVREFQSEATRAEDPDLKSFAQQTAPVLEQHLQMAEQVQTKLTGTSTGTTK